MLTLSDPIFFVDKATGEYTVTGTADAGSRIVYGGSEAFYANSNGFFAVSGKLEESENSGVLSLYVQDSAGNRSDPQLALITKQTKYSVTVSGSYAQSPGAGKYAENSMVTVRAGTCSGYTLSGWTSDDGNTFDDAAAAETTFTMPSGKVEVKAAFVEEIKAGPFDDVLTKAYYYEVVKWAQEKGITGGIGNNLFGPNQPCTRAQIVTFLWRAAGSPEPKGDTAGMTDVVSGSYYEKAVAWAIENGITTGTGEGKLSPYATCTRAQAVTFLARALNAKASGAAEFDDIPTDSYFADAVAWAAANGMTTGIGNGLFAPGNNCTRGQIVTFLWRAYTGK